MSRESFEGLEFDWFAVDSSRNIGHFATAGYGTVPIKILNRLDVEQVDELWSLAEKLLELPVVGEATGHLQGNISDWLELAQRGLFGFDWQHDSRLYHRATTPSMPIVVDDLPIELQRVVRLVELPNVRFRDLQFVRPEELCDCG